MQKTEIKNLPGPKTPSVPAPAGTFAASEAGQHERITFFRDPASGLRAIIAIHSTARGPTLGGVRRWCYASEAEALDDVLRLSRAMTYKAAAAELPLGGGKCVVLLGAPKDAAAVAEAEALGGFVESLGGAYIAAEDVGVDPRYMDWMARTTSYVCGGEKICRGGDPSPHTARGLLSAMTACLEHAGRSRGLDGALVAIQGLGKVGFHTARGVLAAGGRVIGADIREESCRRAAEIGVEIVGPDEIFAVECDLLAPCALGGAIDASRVSKLRSPIVCGAANNILADFSIAALLAERGIIFAPDFVASAGGLIHLAGSWFAMSPAEVEEKIANIGATMRRILRESSSATSTLDVALRIAEERVKGGSRT